MVTYICNQTISPISRLRVFSACHFLISIFHLTFLLDKVHLLVFLSASISVY